MSDLWQRRQQKQTQARKDRARRKAAVLTDLDADHPWVIEASQTEGLQMARVISVHRNRFQLSTSEGVLDSHLASGIPPQYAQDLIVGDWVVLEEQAEQYVISARRERLGTVARMRGVGSDDGVEEHVLAANVDVGVIVVAVQQPTFHANFIDRYLTLLESGSVHPLICLTKTDLPHEPHPILEFYHANHLPVVKTSTLDQRGIEELKTYLRGKTAVFLGQSGAGKSSLVNILLANETARVGEVSDRTGKGMHTTTGSNLYAWEKDSYIIDTPGIRSLGIEHLEKDQIRFFFPEFNEFNPNCKYPDCLHIHEPDCAVQDELKKEHSAINKYRYESYVSMVKDVEEQVEGKK